MQEDDSRAPGWRILLLGGTTASGKSTSARILARRLGIGFVSNDSLWKAILALTTPESHPLFHEWWRPEVNDGPPEALARLHAEEAEAMTPAIEAFIDRELAERSRLVFHGAWITPALAARKCAQTPEVRAVFIDDPNEDDLLGSMVTRSGRSEPGARLIMLARVSVLYGDWLRQGAQRHGVPVVLARPHEALADRILEAADSGAKGER
jgi:2-phosphoglycerate kinase